MPLRLIFNLGALVSITLFPAWATLGVLLAMLLMLRARTYEVLVWGGVLDFLYGVYLHGFPYVPIIYTMTATVMFLVAEFLKPHLVFYDRT
jgi:hypothetical protein